MISKEGENIHYYHNNHIYSNESKLVLKNNKTVKKETNKQKNEVDI